MGLPSKEEMPWLSTETQGDIYKLHITYVELNHGKVKEDTIEEDHIYTMEYVPDSGVNYEVLGMFVAHFGKLELGKPLTCKVRVIAVAKTCCRLEVYGKSGKAFRLVCSMSNYGKSWRLKNV